MILPRWQVHHRSKPWIPIVLDERHLHCERCPEEANSFAPHRFNPCFRLHRRARKEIAIEDPLGHRLQTCRSSCIALLSSRRAAFMMAPQRSKSNQTVGLYLGTCCKQVRCKSSGHADKYHVDQGSCHRHEHDFLCLSNSLTDQLISHDLCYAGICTVLVS